MPEERKLVSLVFADHVGSTAWTAGQDPEVARRLMARYFARMKAIAEVHGGTVEKFIGDAIMVVFGVPKAHEDDAERAVRTALAMRDALGDLNVDLGVVIALRIGVNSGEVATGGAEEDRQFLVTGDAVNVAARLQTGAEPGEVVVGALTERLTRDAIEYEARDPIVAKGKPEPVTAFRAVRARSAVPRSHGRAPVPQGDLVGRARERRQVLESFDRATDERTGYLVTLIGNAGVGKSRLVGEVTAVLAQRPGVRILHGRCLAYGAGITYWPLMDLIREDAGIDSSDDRGAVLGKVAARLASLFVSDRLPALQARISVLLGLDPPAVVLPNVPAERIAAELSWGIRQYLEAIAAHETLVVVIDDLQWADLAVLEVLAQFGDRSSRVPVLFICVARPELLERHPTWAAGRSKASLLQLEPLDQVDTRALLMQLFGTGTLPPVASLIAERSAGNPLFCEEFVRMLVEAKYLDVIDGRWIETRALRELPLPESVQAIVAARLDGLPPAEKITVQRASVIGEHFVLDHLLALGGGGAMEALVRKGLFVADGNVRSGRSLRFGHLLIRDVAYGSLSKADRATLHERVGALLEAQMADRRDEFSELIAYHAAQSYVLSSELRLEPETLGPRTARALSWSTLAGDRALALYATEQAATHYALAIDAGLRQHTDIALLERLYVGRGRALELRGAYDDAIVAYEALERVAADRGDERLRAEALAHQATIYRTPTTRFDAKRADGLLDAALRIARALDDRVLIAQVQRDRIHIRLGRGQVEPAIAAGEESLAAAAAAGSREQIMYTSTDIVCAYREAGQLKRARTAAILAADLANELDDKPMGANSRWSWGHVEFMDGNYDEATRLWSEAIGIAEASDNFWGRSLNVGASASIRFERGDLGGAIRCWEESLRLAEAVGFIVPPALYRGDLAWCYRTAGASGHADRHLEATRTFVESHFPSYGAGLLGLLSRAATAHGTLDAAATYLAQAEVELAAKTELFAFQHAHVGLAAVELMLARRDYDGAITEARARGDVQRGLMRPYVADFEYLEGEALRLEGALDAAAQMLSRARATAAALGGRRILWRVLASLASAEEARGNAAAAERTRAEARAIASGIAESLRPIGFAPGFLAQADVSELMAAVAPPA